VTPHKLDVESEVEEERESEQLRQIEAEPGKETMNAGVQEPPKRESSQRRFTGFPEPFCLDRNTTLTHPDADTSPNATIEAADVDLSRVRSRRKFLRHYSHKSSFHKTTSSLITDPNNMYDIKEYTNSLKELGGRKTVEKEAEQRESLAVSPLTQASPRDGTPSLSDGSTRSSEDEIMSVKEARDEQGYRDGERKKKDFYGS